MARALKVYRTAIGFHDAYVAAPSQKAALAAWGSERNLFTSGAAELVTDPALTKAPLADPGTVVRRSRGTVEEQIAALPKDRPKAGRKPARPKARASRPSRSALDDASKALDDARAERDAAIRAIDDQIAKLGREKDRIRRDAEPRLATLERGKDKAAKAYRRALDDWDG